MKKTQALPKILVQNYDKLLSQSTPDVVVFTRYMDGELCSDSFREVSC